MFHIFPCRYAIGDYQNHSGSRGHLSCCPRNFRSNNIPEEVSEYLETLMFQSIICSI